MFVSTCSSSVYMSPTLPIECKNIVGTLSTDCRSVVTQLWKIVQQATANYCSSSNGASVCLCQHVLHLYNLLVCDTFLYFHYIHIFIIYNIICDYDWQCSVRSQLKVPCSLPRDVSQHFSCLHPSVLESATVMTKCIQKVLKK